MPRICGKVCDMTYTDRFTNTTDTRRDFVRRVNQGEVLTVAGRTVKTLYPNLVPLAKVWLNGTVSVEVEGRSKGKQGTVYVKDGLTVSFTTADPEGDDPFDDADYTD